MINYSHIVSYAPTADIQALYQQVASNHTIKLIKKPQKTLTMIQVREGVGNSLFYLGEALCTECMLSVDDIKGFSVILGDDFDKAISAATIDALMHSTFPEKEPITQALLALEGAHQAKKAVINGAITKSKVEFNLMGE